MHPYVPPSSLKKATIPDRRRATIRRYRLVEAVRESLSRRLTLVSAPAGYGKTTLLVDFVHESGLNVRWLTLDRWDRDPWELLSDLGIALGQNRSRFLETDSRQGPEELRQALRGLIDDAALAAPDGLVLVLDDYHTVDTARAATTVLEDLLTVAPDNWHLLLSSRVKPSLPMLPRLLAERQATWFGAEHLAFDLEEVERFFLEVRGTKIREDEAKVVLEQSEGWVASLVLWSEENVGRPGPPAGASGRGADIVFDYLMAEVFQRQPARVREFLLSTSVLSDMEAHFCDELLARDDSHGLLARLERENVFVSRLDAERPTYRYHQLFRQFLRSQLLRDRRKDFHTLNFRAGELREMEGNWAEAICHFSEAETWPEAIRIVGRSAEHLLAQGRGVTLAEWIDMLPESVVEAEPDLLLYRARVHYEQGEVDEALQILASVTERLDGRVTQEARALNYKAACLSRKGRHKEAVRTARRAVEILRDVDVPSENWAETNLWLGICLGASGQFRRAVGPFKTALSLWEGLGDTYYVSVTADDLAHAISTLGRLAEAESYFEKARQGWARLGNDYRLALTLNNLGVMYYWQGEYQLSWRHLFESMERARGAGNARMEAFAILSLGDVKRDVGEYKEAIEFYSAGLDKARSLGEPYLVDDAIDGLGTTYMLIGDLGKAEILIQHAFAEAEERGGKYERGIFATSRGILSYLRREFTSAAKHLEYAVSLLQRTEAKRELARALLHLAHVYVASRARKRAITLLEEVASLVAELGYSGFLMVEARRCPTVTAYAASKGIGGGLFARLLNAPETGRTETGQSASGRPALIFSYPPVEAYALGQSIVKLDGKIISSPEWSSLKSKEMFFFFLSNSGPLRRDESAASLWSEFDQARATSSFHSALYRLRSATYYDVIINDKGRYRLNQKGAFWFDVQEFEHLLKQADAQPKGSPARSEFLERAIQLYGGPFAKEFYSEWAETLRTNLEEKFLRALASLASYHFAQGSFEESMELCDRIVQLDNFNDEAHCLKIEIHLATGDRISAAGYYNSYVSLLGEQLQTEPPERLVVLREKLATAAR